MYTAFVGPSSHQAEQLVKDNNKNKNFEGRVAVLRENQGLYTHDKGLLHKDGFGYYPNYYNSIPIHGGDLDYLRYVTHLNTLPYHVKELPDYEYYCIDYEGGDSKFKTFNERLKASELYRMYARHTIDAVNFLKPGKWGFYGDYLPNAGIRYVVAYPAMLDEDKLKKHLTNVMHKAYFDSMGNYAGNVLVLLSARYDTAWSGDNINHGKLIPKSTADMIKSLIPKEFPTALFSDVPTIKEALTINEEWSLYS